MKLFYCGIRTSALISNVKQITNLIIYLHHSRPRRTGKEDTKLTGCPNYIHFGAVICDTNGFFKPPTVDAQ